MTDWYQQALTPPTVLELHLRVGIIPAQDHLQAMIELTDPTTGVLLGQWSYPHSGLRNMLAVLDWARDKAYEALGDHAEPF